MTMKNKIFPIHYDKAFIYNSNDEIIALWITQSGHNKSEIIGMLNESKTPYTDGWHYNSDTKTVIWMSSPMFQLNEKFFKSKIDKFGNYCINILNVN